MGEFYDAMIQGLNHAEARFGFDRDLVEINVSVLFLNLILGSGWCDQHVNLTDNPDPWMCNGTDAWLQRNPVGAEFHKVACGFRVVRLANALFTLFVRDGCEGFDLLRTRIQQRRDTRSVFVETEIASMLVHNGCSIKVVPETGIRGRDFDLVVTTPDGGVVNVEVSAMSEGPLTVKAVLNKLRDKRDQVPNDQPAVLYLHIPPDWMDDDQNAAAVFTEAVHRFFLKSKRYAIITLVWEKIELGDGGGWPSMYLRPAYHTQARHQVVDMELFALKPNLDGSLRFADEMLPILQKARERARTGAF